MSVKCPLKFWNDFVVKFSTHANFDNWRHLKLNFYATHLLKIHHLSNICCDLVHSCTMGQTCETHDQVCGLYMFVFALHLVYNRKNYIYITKGNKNLELMRICFYLQFDRKNFFWRNCMKPIRRIQDCDKKLLVIEQIINLFCNKYVG